MHLQKDKEVHQKLALEPEGGCRLS